MTDKLTVGTDDATFGLYLGLAVIGTLTLTVVSVVIATAVVVVAWFFGGPKQVAFIALSAAVFSAGIELLIPGFFDFVSLAFGAYRDAASHDHYFLSVTIEWLRFALIQQAWIRLTPFGLLLGAVSVFAIEARRKSVARSVFGGEVAPRPSPWARIMLWCALTGPPLYRGMFVLGGDQLTGERITISRKQLNTHVVISGRSGLGKTVAVLTYCSGCARLSIPVVYVDGKGDSEVKESLRKIAAENNVAFYAFDSTDPAAGCAWDVMADMNATAQADMLVRQREFSEAHFEAKAARFALIACKVLHFVGIPVDLFIFREALSVDYLIGILRPHVKKQDNEEGRALMKEVIALRNIEAEAVDSLISEIGRLTDAIFGFLFNIEKAKQEGRTILRLVQARKEKAVVYIGLPALEYSETARKVGSLCIAALKATLPVLEREHKRLSEGKLPLEASQLFYVFDEWSVFAGDAVLNLVNMGRSFGGSFCLAAQSFADFITDRGDQLLRQVAASVSTFVVHGLTDSEDAEYAAKIFGTQAVVQHTAQTVEGAMTGAASARRTKEFVFHPDDIKNMGVGEALYMNKNDKDDKTKKAIIRLIKVRKSTN